MTNYPHRVPPCLPFGLIGEKLSIVERNGVGLPYTVPGVFNEGISCSRGGGRRGDVVPIGVVSFDESAPPKCHSNKSAAFPALFARFLHFAHLGCKGIFTGY